MKKSIIIAGFALGAIVFGTNNVKAQIHTASTAVNIILSDVISIDAGSIANGGAVNFNYVTAEDYNTSTTVNVPTSLKVTSTKPFNIDVKADQANFTDGTNEIPVDVLTIEGTSSEASKTMGGTRNKVVLSITDQTLISNAPLGSALTLDLNYTIPATESSSSKILGKPAGTYTQKVTYTATAI